ncbi:hypothetical protein F5Y17DRAFT_418136 [Xylariaceae sp. FL0594]|nr:hypothetical protein F5Y17DRAFT_418136 [Xylariaceae sp. FL0594]
MSASRAFAQRSSAALRTLTRKAAPAVRRGYASPSDAAHATANKTSDLPWMIAAVGVTGVGAAYLGFGPGAGKGQAKHGHGVNVDHEAKAEIEETPQKFTGGDPKAPAGEGKSEDKTGPKGAADPASPGKRSAVGQNVPPASGDNSSLAENWEEGKEKKQEFDEAIRSGQTRVATSSSEAPSKRKGGEHPREDPQKGEGEAVKKGSSKEEES